MTARGCTRAVARSRQEASRADTTDDGRFRTQHAFADRYGSIVNLRRLERAAGAAMAPRTEYALIAALVMLWAVTIVYLIFAPG